LILVATSIGKPPMMLSTPFIIGNQPSAISSQPTEESKAECRPLIAAG